MGFHIFLSSILTPASATLLALSLSFSWFLIRGKFTPHRLPLPPGPRGLPFLGSALEINRDEPWLTYEKWKQLYGEIVSCKLLGQTYIIINSERVARALLVQRSNIYSDRPVIQTSILFGVEFNTAHLSDGSPTWKAHRKIFHQTLGGAMIPKYHDSLVKRVRELLHRLLHSPNDFESHMNTYSASIIMSITYGYDVIPGGDPFLTPLEQMIGIVVLTTPERAILLNLFPQLVNLPSWFPGAELQRLAKRCKELSPRVREGPFQFVKECLLKGIENNSMVGQLLKVETAAGQDRAAYEQDIKDCAASSFIAGTDTTRSVLTSLILALILFPEAQHRAQEEIDRVVGRDRLPNFDDAPSLPYIDALLRETMRWASIVPMGIPHMVKEDDVFEDCFIPKGSTLIVNIWGIARSEDKFPDPTIFVPERHFGMDGNLLSEDLSGLNYGYGRRLCPGRHLASASVWLGAANILAMFKFSKAISPAGEVLDVSPRFTTGVARRPLSFPCLVTPRFVGAEELLA